MSLQVEYLLAAAGNIAASAINAAIKRHGDE
jgi:hypothetical protein